MKEGMIELFERRGVNAGRYDPNSEPPESEFEVGDFVVMEAYPDAEQIRWGSNDDPRGKVLLGVHYMVKNVEIHSWHTKLELEGVEGRFNSVSFRRAV